MSRITAGLLIRQEGNVQYLNGELAWAAKCETLCLKLVPLNSLFC